MSVFFGYIKLDKKIVQHPAVQPEGYFDVSGENFFIRKQSQAKFYQDETFYHDDECIVILNGVLLNRMAIQQKHGKVTLAKAIFAEYQARGNDFCKSFRGSFSGLLFDKACERWLIFTSHFGDKQIFYSINSGFLFFGSKVSELTDQFKQKQLSFGVDEEGIGSMLTYGFMLEDHTLIKEIKKLPYGSLIEVSDQKPVVKRYWDFDNTTYTGENEKDIVAHMDFLFRNAVKLEFEKDREHSLQHFATLSAGLDSKMVVAVAHELGYTKQVNFTYSRHLYADQTVAQQMANDLGHSFIFSLLNENNFFEHYEELAKVNSGSCSFAGNISGFNSIQHINFNPYGIVHMGQLGDVVLGSYNKTPSHTAIMEFSGAFSSKKFPVAPKIDKTKYRNNEHFMLTQRGFNGILQGNLIYQEHTEVCSPFMDVDFFEYCMRIPPELRFNHNLYLKWVKQFHPATAQYVWDKTMAPLTVPIIRYKNILFPISNLWHIRRALLPRIGKMSKKFSFLARQHSMAPQQYWYEKNHSLQEKIDLSIQSSGLLNTFNKDINNAVDDIKGNDFLSKSQLLTVTEALKHLMK